MTMETAASLAPTGESLWRRLTDAYEFDVWELVIAGATCRQADDVAGLGRAISEDGFISLGSQGQLRLAQTLGEPRQGRLSLAHLVDALGIPAEEAPAKRAAPERVAEPCIVGQWLDVAQWDSNSLGRVDDVEPAAEFVARHHQRDARLQWREAEARRRASPTRPPRSDAPRWADVEAAQHLLVRWVGSYGAAH